MKDSARNTDREIWRKVSDDYYSPSIHVTFDGRIGINVGGRVIVATIEKWHRALIEASGEKASGMTAKVTYVSECPQCGLPTTRADILVLDDEHAIDLSAPSAPSPAPLPAEVEEAMATLKYTISDRRALQTEDGIFDAHSALAVIRAALKSKEVGQ